MKKWLLQILPALLVALLGREALAANYATCALWEYQTIDSGNGEDAYPSGDQGGFAIAAGVRAHITSNNSNYSTSVWANADGCFYWSTSSANAPFTVRFTSKTKDTKDNVVRIHDSGNDTVAPYGSEYSFYVNNYWPTAGSTDLVLIGDETQMATATAMASHVMASYNEGLSDRTVHVGLRTGDCDGNSAHFGSPASNSNITNGVHLVKLTKCPSTPGSRRKFTIGHEMGHAMLALYYGKFAGAQNGSEPSASSGYAGDAYNSPCTVDGAYSIDSAEWSGLAFREGFAHFVGARAFNDKETTGTFTWFGTAEDLETHAALPGNPGGGLLENVCCPGCSANDLRGVATNGDWMRWLWDIHTNNWSCCNHTMTKLEIYKLYRFARVYAEDNGTSASGLFSPAVLLSMWATGANACLVEFGNASCGSPKVQDSADFNGIGN